MSIVDDVNRLATIVAPAWLILVGCVHGRCPPSGLTTAAKMPAPVLPDYRLACSDVVEIRFAENPDWDSLASVDTDGTIAIGPFGVKVPVAGATTDEAKTRISNVIRLHNDTPQVRVVEAQASRIELHGPMVQRQRSIPYRGEESVIEFLLRTDALKRGCYDPGDVAVLRPNVASGREAELFRVEIDALMKGDHRTNVILQPGDQVFVGESRRSSLVRLLPERLKPVYQRMMGLAAEAPRSASGR